MSIRGINMDVNEIWEKTLSLIRKDINSAVGYNTYIKDIKPISLEGDVFRIAVSTAIIKNMVLVRYSKEIEKTVSKFISRPVSLEVMLKSEVKAKEKQAGSDNSNAVNLNPRYTFDNFVVGSSNAYATAVAKRVTEFPGQ